MATVTKKDVEKIIDDIKAQKGFKWCIHCGIFKDTYELHGGKCRTRNMLGTKINKHVFRVKKK